MQILLILILQHYTQKVPKNRPKSGEEGVETALAAVAQDKAEVISEATDLVYHLTVLLHHQDLQWYEIIAKLQERHQGIGLHPEGGNK